jgi:hypothetical protein
MNFRHAERVPKTDEFPKAGRITAAGMTKEVRIRPVLGPIKKI